MNWSGLFRVFAPRILGSVASLAAGFIFTKTKGAVTLDPSQIVVLGTTMLATYGVAHTATAATLNPTAAASPIVANEGVDVKKDLQAAGK